jgi:hypothetical protein
MNLRQIQALGMGWRAASVAAGLLAAVVGKQAYALGLGEPSVTSALGQPLQMTVPLVMAPDAELAQECVRLVPGSPTGETTPTLNAARMTVDAVNRKLRIESPQPITEPTLRVVVELGCNERIRREFALLLDPPLIAPDASAGGTAEAASPLGLGMAQISAVLGQRLSLKVPVLGSEAGSLTASCVHLADPISGEGAPVLREADIRVVPREAGSLIEVATPGPVTEPAVRIALDVGCHDPVRREYAIMLGMPTLAASNADNTVAAAEAPPPQAQPKPAPRRAPRKALAAVPAVPQQQRASAPPADKSEEAAAKAPPAAAPKADRLVLGSSPQDSIGPLAAGADLHAVTADANAELLKRLDTMSRQIAELQTQLIASRQHEQALERKAFETREQWTWSAGALGGLLLGGALVLAWRQRRPVARPAWEPVMTRPGPITTVRPMATRSASSTASRESSEIGGRATMPPSSSMGGTHTESPLTDERHTQITVTELHDTVQVIKELYATVLERNTAAGAPATTGGKPHAPLDLDLRTPTRIASPATRAGQDRPGGKEQHPIDERFTELPTEVALDLDLNTSAAGAPELTDLLKPGDAGRAPTQAERRAAAAPAAASPARAQEAATAARAPDAEPVSVDLARSQAAAQHELAEDRLTQTPTEVSIDIDVGTATDFATTVGRPGPRTKPSMDPIDLQLDLSQPQTRSKRRSA